MDKAKKAVIAVLVDMVLLAVIIFSVYMLLGHADAGWKKNLYTILVVLSIPTGFYVTYMSVAGDKYEINESELYDDEEEEKDEEM